MKKTFTWILILSLLLIPFTPAVYAKEEKEDKETKTKVQVVDLKKDEGADEIEEDKTLPLGHNIVSNDFDLDIIDYYLNVYEINEDSPEVTETSTDGTATVTISEDEKNYRDEVVVADYDIPREFYEKTPVVKTGKLSEVDALFVDTGLTITKEDLEEILEREMGLVTDTKTFLVDLCVEYSFNEIPTKYSHAYSYDIVRILQNLANLDHLEELDLTTLHSIVLNRITIELDEDGNPVLNFPKTVESRNAISFMNYIGFSDSELLTPSDEPKYYLMFYNVDNIEALMDTEPEEGNNPVTSTTDDIVPIPNTGKMVSSLYFIEGFILMITGFGIIYSTIRYKQKRD